MTSEISRPCSEQAASFGADAFLGPLFDIGGLSKRAQIKLKIALDASASPSVCAKIWREFLQKLRDEGQLERFDRRFLSSCDQNLLHDRALLDSLNSLLVAPDRLISGLFYWLDFRSPSWSEADDLALFERAARFRQLLSDQNIWIEPKVWLSDRQNCREKIAALDRCIQNLAAQKWRGLCLNSDLQRAMSANFHCESMEQTRESMQQSRLRARLAQAKASGLFAKSCELEPAEFALVAKIASQHADAFLDGDSGIYFLSLCNALSQRVDVDLFATILSAPHSTLAGHVAQLELLLEAQDRSDEVQLLSAALERPQFAKRDLARLVERLQGERAAKIPSDSRPLEAQIGDFFSLGLGDVISRQTLQSDLKRVLEIERECQFDTLSELVQRAKVVRANFENGADDWEDRRALVALGRLGLWISAQKYPTCHQTLTVLAMMRAPNAQRRGLIAQMRTGEGKSLCQALLALCLAGQGRCVDIVSSSRYLARRDWETFTPFFDLFEISTSHICQDHPPREKFNAQLLYGTNSDFEFAHLREMLQCDPLRQWRQNGRLRQREFDAVIVDEVDNLLIDTTLNASRIAIAARVRHSWVYAPIWAFVKRRPEEVDRALTGSDESLKALMCQLRAELKSAREGVLEDRQEVIGNEQLALWLRSALIALLGKENGRDYVVKKSRQSTGRIANKIVIVELETGRLHENSRWKGGLHEFLEIKHDLPLCGESLTPASTDHATYFQKYRSLFGLTGTLGGEEERSEVRSLQNVDLCEVPTFRPRRHVQLTPRIAPASRHASALTEEILAIQNQDRPSLLLFEHIEETLQFSQHLSTVDVEHNVLNEVQEVDENWIISRAGRPGQVTLATNTAGRGTDIILSAKALNSGGLHVVFTYYPESDRVEQQGFGRASRQGQPGTGRLLLSDRDRALQQQGTDNLASPNFSPEIRVQQLRQHRQNRVQGLSQRRLQSAQLGSIQYRYLMAFTSQLRDWERQLQSPQILNLASDWKTQMSSIISPNGPTRDTALRFKSLKLLNQIGSEPSRAEISQIFTSLRRELKTRIQQIWAEEFFEKLPDLSQCSEGQSTPQALDRYSAAVQALYSQKNEKWAQYLKNPTASFRELIGLHPSE